jgi:hypothetical protein
MNPRANDSFVSGRLRLGIVLRVLEDTCEIVSGGRRRSVHYATAFPSPRTERVSPGHLVAVAAAPDGSDVAIWRWYDAVILDEEAGLIRLWEPAHGEVVAQPRQPQRARLPGSRAYLSSGLPGAEWWVAGAVAARPEDAAVELDEVERFYDERGLWHTLTG